MSFPIRKGTCITNSHDDDDDDNYSTRDEQHQMFLETDIHQFAQ